MSRTIRREIKSFHKKKPIDNKEFSSQVEEFLREYEIKNQNPYIKL